MATYNTSLYDESAGGLIRRLEAGDDDAKKIAAVLQRVRPDIVLLDISMPGGTGLEARPLPSGTFALYEVIRRLPVRVFFGMKLRRGSRAGTRTREIEGDIEHTRAELSETIDALQEKLRPSNIVSDATDRVKTATTERVRHMAESAGETAQDMMRSTRHATSGIVEGARRPHTKLPVSQRPLEPEGDFYMIGAPVLDRERVHHAGHVGIAAVGGEHGAPQQHIADGAREGGQPAERALPGHRPGCELAALAGDHHHGAQQRRRRAVHEGVAARELDRGPRAPVKHAECVHRPVRGVDAREGDPVVPGHLPGNPRDGKSVHEHSVRLALPPRYSKLLDMRVNVTPRRTPRLALKATVAAIAAASALAALPAAAAAWAEIRDTAHDHDWVAPDSETPRQLGSRLALVVGADPVARLQVGMSRNQHAADGAGPEQREDHRRADGEHRVDHRRPRRRGPCRPWSARGRHGPWRARSWTGRPCP